MKVFLAQINCRVGNIRQNYQKILAFYQSASAQDANLVVFPELSLSGYLLKDLVFEPHFFKQIEDYLETIASATNHHSCQILLGAPIDRENAVQNAAILIGSGKILKEYYINPELDSSQGLKIESNKTKTTVLFYDQLANCSIDNNYKELIIFLSASAFDIQQHNQRQQTISHFIARESVPVLYINRIGADEHLIFDGGSSAFDANGRVICSSFWEESLVEIELHDTELKCITSPKQEVFTPLENLYLALMSGLADYCAKNSFTKVMLGISGGIDSAFVAMLASDAIGSQFVHCVAMPSRYSSKSSALDALELTQNLKCQLTTISIEHLFNQALLDLNPVFNGMAADTTEENIQARIRGLLLMAIANKSGALLLATSNKSESAVGYATLYGDMCGGFAPICDVYKTQLYELAKWRNHHIPKNSKNHQKYLLPQSIIDKEPSAELAFGQKDQDTLPPYETLDLILTGLIENNLPAEEIASKTSINLELVLNIKQMLLNSEFKRAQSPLGSKISTTMLSLNRKFPLTLLSCTE